MACAGNGSRRDSALPHGGGRDWRPDYPDENVHTQGYGVALASDGTLWGCGNWYNEIASVISSWTDDILDWGMSLSGGVANVINVDGGDNVLVETNRQTRRWPEIFWYPPT